MMKAWQIDLIFRNSIWIIIRLNPNMIVCVVSIPKYIHVYPISSVCMCVH